MARKNIFDQLSTSISFGDEIERLNKLLLDEDGIKIVIASNPMQPNKKDEIKYCSIEQFVDMYSFKRWKSRGTCIDCNDMRIRLGIPTILIYSNPSHDKVLTFLEYVANMLMLIQEVTFKERYKYYETDVTRAAKQNLQTILDWLNCEEKKLENEQKVVIVEKNAATTSVAEIVDASLAYKIIQYNHFSLRGDISAKKSILLALGAEIEPRRKEIYGANRQLTDNIFYLLNNLNVRHNNKNEKDKNYKDYIAKITPKELEIWYDELYQMCLLAFLELDQFERNRRVDELKSNMETVQSFNSMAIET